MNRMSIIASITERSCEAESKSKWKNIGRKVFLHSYIFMSVLFDQHSSSFNPSSGLALPVYSPIKLFRENQSYYKKGLIYRWIAPQSKRRCLKIEAFLPGSHQGASLGPALLPVNPNRIKYLGVPMYERINYGMNTDP